MSALTFIEGLALTLIIATWAIVIVAFINMAILPSIKRRRTPVLCAYHAYKLVKKGKYHMAIIDAKRCKMCDHEPEPKDAA